MFYTAPFLLIFLVSYLSAETSPHVILDNDTEQAIVSQNQRPRESAPSPLQPLLSEELEIQQESVSFREIVPLVLTLFERLSLDRSERIVMALLFIMLAIYLIKRRQSQDNELPEDAAQEPLEHDILKQNVEEGNMPSEVKEEALKQIRRLQHMPPDSGEAASTRDYLDWLTNMPWNLYVNDTTIDLKRAKIILDEEHFGLASVKDKILDYLSVTFFKSKYNSQILCLAGPPGVGKTSIGNSIAKALGKKFAHIPLGGVRDEAELLGSRRVYIGTHPGRIIQSIKQAQSSNPVLMFDEIDKIAGTSSAGWGNPAAALLEIFDPKQNTKFYDHYLGVPFDISNVMFIATCNDFSAISGPLRDRMEVIQIAGYTASEKLQIATKHLLPKMIANMGLQDQEVSIDEGCIAEIIKSYTKESGVRDLERCLAKLCSKFARAKIEENSKIVFTKDNLASYLGEKKRTKTVQDSAPC